MRRPFSSHLFDLVLGPDGWRVARQAPRERGLILGVADCRTTIAGMTSRSRSGPPVTAPRWALVASIASAWRPRLGWSDCRSTSGGSDEAARDWPRRPPWPACEGDACGGRCRSGRAAEAGGPGRGPIASARAGHRHRWLTGDPGRSGAGSFPSSMASCDSPIRSGARLTERRGLGNTVELLVVGRRTGRERRRRSSDLLAVGERRYLGHANASGRLVAQPGRLG